MDWTEERFYNSTFRAFRLTLQGRDAADQYRDNKLNHLVRNLAYVVAISAFGGSKINHPSQIWPHPWDDENGERATRGPTQEDIERLKQVFARYDEMELRDGTSGFKHTDRD